MRCRWPSSRAWWACEHLPRGFSASQRQDGSDHAKWTSLGRIRHASSIWSEEWRRLHRSGPVLARTVATVRAFSREPRPCSSRDAEVLRTGHFRSHPAPDWSETIRRPVASHCAVGQQIGRRSEDPHNHDGLGVFSPRFAQLNIAESTQRLTKRLGH